MLKIKCSNSLLNEQDKNHRVLSEFHEINYRFGKMCNIKMHHQFKLITNTIVTYFII